MVTGFSKSEEGVKEYSKLGLPYPSELFDDYYEQWLKDTSAEGLPSGVKEKVYTAFYRIKLDPEGEGQESKEFVAYHLQHNRIDKSQNVRPKFRSFVGIYPIPDGLYETRDIDFGRKERFLKEVLTVNSGYSIPWNKETIEWLKKLKKEGSLHPTKTRFYTHSKGDIILGGGSLISAETFEDFINGDTDELQKYGKVVKSKEEREVMDKKIESARARVAVTGR